MSKLIFLFAVVAVAVALEQPATVVKQSQDVHAEGYVFNYETSNGIKAEETGSLKKAGGEEDSITVQGTFDWTAPDGTPVHISFVADENGYQPTGKHLPVAPEAPPVPEYIVRALEYIRTHPQKEESTKHH